MRKGLIIQIIYSLIILFLFYYLGFSIYSLLVLAILFTMIILLKGKLYNKIKETINKKFPKFAKLPSWLNKLIIIFIFILIYLILKQIIFYLLKLAGMDIEKTMMDSLNKSLNG